MSEKNTQTQTQAKTTATPETKIAPSTGDLLLGDAKESARRLAAKQFIKMTREPLVALLSRHLDPHDEGMRAKVAAFLDTDLGEGIVAMLLSLGVSVIPTNQAEVAQLAQQLRIKAMTDVGDVVADLLMAPLREVLSVFIRGENPVLAALPAATANVAVPSFSEVSQPVQVNG